MTRTLSSPDRVVIVGASAAGISAAEALRAQGYEGSVELIGAEPHLAYDRPPLSKQFLAGTWGHEQLSLRPDLDLDNIGVTARLGTAAVALDTRQPLLHLSDGSETQYDRLLVATGVHARRLPGTRGVAGVHVLRTVDDALALRDELRSARRVFVVGGGFLGAEVASVMAATGAEVTIASPTGHLLEPVLGTAVGEQLTELHRANGVVVRSGAGARVRSVVSRAGRATRVELDAGAVLEADLVVVAIGSTPAVEWLRTSSVSIGDGVECAPDCSAGDGIYAAGDVARWHNPLFGVSMRVEHRTNAVDQAIHVAQRIVQGDRAPYAPVPYFWSDQHDRKLQSYGWLRGHDEVRIVAGSVPEGRLIALYRRGSRLTGVLTMGAAKALRQWRTRLVEQIDWQDALDLV